MRLKPTERKEAILAAALPLAARRGYMHITRNEIASAAGVSGPTVQYHFGTVAKLRVEIMRYAVKQRNARVVAQGLVNNDRHAMRADDELKRQARRTM